MVASDRFDHRLLGRYGEDRAAAWYESHGYVVLARNWRCEHGELDLVVARDDHVVVCEVKTRSSARFGLPVEAVGPAKQRRLRRLAQCWVTEAAPFRVRSLRIDVVGILGGRLSVIEGAC